MNLLQYGDKGDEVKILQRKLKDQGWFFDGDVRGNFLEMTENAVRDFQLTHLDSSGKWLEVDGIVGDLTWWALNNPSGDSQRSLIDATIPFGLTPERKNQLEVAMKYWRLNVHEVPDVSNQGDGVDQFIAGYGAVPWCMLFVSQCDLEANKSWAIGRREAGTYRAWKRSEELGIFHYKENYNPVPGDIFLMQYKGRNGVYNGTGHVGFVLRVSEDRSVFQTVEGNAGNRVKVGERSIDQSSLIGYINGWGDKGHCDFETGLSPRFSKSLAREITR